MSIYCSLVSWSVEELGTGTGIFKYTPATGRGGIYGRQHDAGSGRYGDGFCGHRGMALVMKCSSLRLLASNTRIEPSTRAGSWYPAAQCVLLICHGSWA